MALVDTTPQAPARADRVEAPAWVALGLALLSAASYVVALVIPYYAVGAPDLDAAAAPSAAQPWSYPAVLGPLPAVLLFWSMCVAPFASAGVAWWSLHRVWTTRAVRGVGRIAWAALVVSVATFAWFCVQGGALMVWMLD